MTKLTPLAHVLHSKLWSLVGRHALAHCETISEENAYMNRAADRYAVSLLATPPDILGLVWGVHPNEAMKCREGIRAAIAEAARPTATPDSVYDAYRAIADI